MNLPAKAIEIVNTVNMAIDRWDKHIQNLGLDDVWRGAQLSFLGKGELTNPLGVNVKVNRILTDLLTLVARDQKFLMGSQPYMPLEARRRDDPVQSKRARLQQQVVNDFLTRDSSYYQAMHRLLSYLRGFGTAFMEQRWRAVPESLSMRDPVYDDELGQVVGFERNARTSIKEGPLWVAHQPWTVFVHPHGNELDKKFFQGVEENVHVEEIIHLIEAKVFDLPPGVVEDDLRKSPAQFEHSQDYDKRWRKDQDIYEDGLKADVGKFCRYYEKPSKKYPRGRWAYTWNYSIPLLKEGGNYFTEPMWDVIPYYKTPLTLFRDVTNIGPESFYGQGLYQMLMDVIQLSDDLRSFYVDRLMMGAAQWMLYDPNAVNPEHLNATYGARIPINRNFGGGVADAIHPLNFAEPDPALLDAAERADYIGDDRIGLHFPITGEPGPRKETATTFRGLQAAGNERLESATRMIELTSMSDMATFLAQMIDENITDEELVDVLGEDNALFMGSVDPRTLRGGYQWKFEGSTRIVENGQKLEALTNTYNLTINDPYMQRGNRVRVLRDMWKFTGVYDEEEVSRIVPDLETQPAIPIEARPQGPAQAVTGPQQPNVSRIPA